MSTTQLAMDKLEQARMLLAEAREIEQAAGHKVRAMGINNLVLGTSAIADVVINTESAEVSS